MLIGEAFVGSGTEVAHVNTVQGPRSGPVGAAWVTALATPSAGHAPFVVCLQPGTAVRPSTLLVSKAPLETAAHRTMTWGAAQAGVAAGVADALADGVLTGQQASDDVVVAAVWVHPDAADADAVFANNRAATREALRNGVLGLPDPARQGRPPVSNGFYRPPGTPTG